METITEGSRLKTLTQGMLGPQQQSSEGEDGEQGGMCQSYVDPFISHIYSIVTDNLEQN